ncbi:MAG TPA: PhoD-like phosphatase N-terminal domain-containing protein, partial [Usitatibacteraceae bacterium]|nr:PhoD-like phosphatase N-terminal domain-containing protein [Usitatibacteraceae bacterium]
MKTLRPSRRAFALRALALAGAAFARPVFAATSAPRFSSDPFSLGVASGSPSADGVLLWTRLAPEPLTGGGLPDAAFDVRWEVAHDEAFARIAAKGSAAASPDR